MRTIARFAPKPTELVQLESDGGDDFGVLTPALDREFHGVCAYCERQPLWRAKGDALGARDTDLTVAQGVLFTCDHFRPRHLFRDRIYDWHNLVYACQPCNRVKGGQWPTDVYQADAYVDPCAATGQGDDPSSVFEYDLISGEIKIRASVSGNVKANAKKTIDDLALNKHRTQREAIKRNAGLRRVDLAQLRQRHVRDLKQLLVSAASITPDLLPAIVATAVSPSSRFSSISRQLVEETEYRRYLPDQLGQ